MKKIKNKEKKEKDHAIKDPAVREWAHLHLRSGLGAAEPNVDFVSHNGLMLPVKRKH